MKKTLFLLAVAVIPFTSNAQEIGLESNYKSKKEQRQSKFKPHEAGDITTSLGLSSVTRGFGTHYNLGVEYMINSNLGIRGNVSRNNFSANPFWGVNRYQLDVTYHFIQTKRWDVYAFAGISHERTRYPGFSTPGEYRLFKRQDLNAGVGVRYKITPSFGVQAELGTTTNLSIYKKFNVGKKN